MAHIPQEEVRQKIYKAQKSRLKNNVKLFQDRVIVQTQIAQILNHDSVAAQKIDRHTLAQNPENVGKLLNELAKTYHHQSRPILEEMLELKKEDDPRAKRIEPWDYAFYDRILKQKKAKPSKYAPQDVKKYFPAASVLRRLFDHAEKMFGLKITKVEGSPVWGEGVEYFRVVGPDGQILGHFYTDLYNRDGKNPGKSYASLLKSRRTRPQSLSRKPISLMVSSLGEVGEENLLSPIQVSKVFHEFGHILHSLFAKSPYRSLSGYPQPNDAVEIPATFFEKLAWHPRVLQFVSQHPETGEPMPLEMAETLVEEHKQGLKLGLLKGAPFQSIAYQENALFLSILDQAIYTAAAEQGEDFDVRLVYIEQFIKFYGSEPIDGGDFIGAFFHPMVGYDADYYSYLWAHLYSASLYDFVTTIGALNPMGYIEYRRVLESDGRANLLDVYHNFFRGAPSTGVALEMSGFAP